MDDVEICCGIQIVDVRSVILLAFWRVLPIPGCMVELPKTLGFWVLKSFGFFAVLGFGFGFGFEFEVLGFGWLFALGKMEFRRKIFQKLSKINNIFELLDLSSQSLMHSSIFGILN